MVHQQEIDEKIENSRYEVFALVVITHQLDVNNHYRL